MIKRALVAGAAGFLGSHLCDSLLADGYFVVGIDNLSTGSKQNIAHMGPYKFDFIEHDITQPIPEELGEFDQVWNFACPASPEKYQLDPIHTLMTSVMGVNNLLRVVVDSGEHCKIFHTSTSEVYGDPQVDIQNESYWGNVNPVGIRSCYDEGKRAAETLLTDHARMYGTKIKIVRIFNTYGPRMSPTDGRVITNFINQALDDKALSVYGDGSQTRSFCYYTDAIRGYRELMDSDDSVNYPVNIGNPDEFTIIDVARKVSEKVNGPGSYTFYHKPLPSDDPKQRKPDISLAKKVLGWEPKVDIDYGLDMMIEYFKGFK